MKYAIVLSFMLFSISSIVGQSNYFEKKNVLKVNPAEFSRAEFKLSYECYFQNRKHSILLSPTIILKSDEDDQRQGWRVMGQYRYYLSHLNKDSENALFGMYNTAIYSGVYGLYLDYNDDFEINYFSEEKGGMVEVNNERNIVSQEGGVLLGLQLDITKRFVIDFYVGGGIRFSKTTNTFNEDVEYYAPNRGGIFAYEYEGVKPTVGLMIGFTL